MVCNCKARSPRAGCVRVSSGAARAQVTPRVHARVAQGLRRVSLLRRLLLLASVACSLVGIRCQAADIESTVIKGATIITVVGDIVADDDRRFEVVASTVQGRAVVVLDSHGGKLAAGLIIGDAIRARSYMTVVPENATCASVCGLIWLAGTERFVSRSARIGFHRASFIDGSESGVGDALIGAYLTRLGLSYDAVIYLTSAPPNQIQWLHPDTAMRLGITVARLETVQQTASSGVPAVPTQPRVAARAVQAAPEPDLPAAPVAPPTAAYTEGRHDRLEYQRWVQSLPRGPYQNGATFWASNRDVTPPPSCSPPGSNGDWQSGCVLARARLGQIDRRRAIDKDYSLGWGSP